LREIERVIKDRHGRVPDTDDADVYLIPVARCFRKILVDKGKIASVGAVLQRFGFWCDTWAPHVTTDQAADIVREVLTQPPKLDFDDDLGARLRLSYADRLRLKITTIGSYDVNRKSRKKRQRARRRERNRLRAAEKRRAKGAMPRAKYEASSLSKTKPWEQMGISRAKYYRLTPDQRNETSASPHPSISSKGDGLVSRSQLNARQSPTTDEIDAAMPPAIASGTPQSITCLGRVDGAAVVGNPDADRQRKTKFPTSMKLTKTMKARAIEAHFEPQKIIDMFQMFRDWHLAKGSTYSSDWEQVWFDWCDREAHMMVERCHKARARARYYGAAKETPSANSFL
jgi:hypothetical protein